MRNFEFSCGFLLMRDIGWLRPGRAQESLGESTLKKDLKMHSRSKELSRTDLAHRELNKGFYKAPSWFSMININKVDSILLIFSHW